MNDFDLSALASTPVPDLARPDQVRARGEQRRRRGHVLVAGAAALVVALGAGTAVALVDGGRPDALLPAAPTTTPTGTAPPSAEEAFLTADELHELVRGPWNAERVAVGDAPEAYDRCDFSAVARASWVRQRHYTSVDGERLIVIEIDGYSSAAAASASLDRRRQEIQRCPVVVTDGPALGSQRSATLLDADAGVGFSYREVERECQKPQSSCTDRSWLRRETVQGELLVTIGAFPARQLSAGQLESLANEAAARASAADPGLYPPTPSPTPYVSPVPVTLGPLDERSFVEENRIGPVEVGMTIEEAEAAAEQDLRQEGDVLGSCVYYAPSTGKPDVSFMVIDGVVSRIDVDSGTTTTNNNDIGIGSTEAEVKAAYRGTVVSKHPYTDGHYLRVLSEDGRFALLFETDGAKVTSFRSGYPDAVDQVEGCA